MAVRTRKELFKDAQRVKLHPGTCSKSELYYRTLKIVASSRTKITPQQLTKFISSVSRSAVHVPYKERLNSGADIIQIKKTFKSLLMKLGLPYNTVAFEKKPGYTLVGHITILGMHGADNSTHDVHAIAGVFTRFGRPILINSAHPEVYNINWRRDTDAQLRSKWHTLKWSKEATFAGVIEEVDVYARKLY